VLFSAYAGLRPCEVVALKVGRLDLLRGTARVAEAAPEVAGRLRWGSVKTHEARTVRLPRFLREELAAHLAGRAVGPEDLVFTAARGGPLRDSKWVPGYFKPAVRAAGLPFNLRWYDLRHTCASLLIREGASVKAVQRQLGHATASITLDTYGHLYGDEMEALAERLERLRAAAAAPQRDPPTPRPSFHSPKVQVSEAIGGCRRRGSNPHALAGPTLLRRGCLPIPALRRADLPG
jgi:integrase